MATQNPIEMEGTYPLPEAQLDRFLMKILVEYPSREELSRIVERTIQKEEARVEPVLDRDEILGSARGVPRGAGGAACAGLSRSQLVMATQPDEPEAHAAGAKVHPLRQFAARRAGAGGMRTRVLR